MQSRLHYPRAHPSIELKCNRSCLSGARQDFDLDLPGEIEKFREFQPGTEIPFSKLGPIRPWILLEGKAVAMIDADMWFSLARYLYFIIL